MPELPEVETVRLGLEAKIKGRKLTALKIDRHDLRVPIPQSFGQTFLHHQLDHIERRAKYLLMFFKNTEQVLVWHLGMSGKVLILEGNEREKPSESHVHVVMLFDNEVEVRFRDPRRFGLMLPIHKMELNTHPLLAHLGPEPFAADFSSRYLQNVLKTKAAPIKNILCDQTVVAGLGNIYACEVLFRVGISPFRAGNSLRDAEIHQLIQAIHEILNEAIQAGGSSLRDHVQPNGSLGYFQKRFHVYDREDEPCPRCPSSIIARKVQAGRSTFYCPNCQR